MNKSFIPASLISSASMACLVLLAVNLSACSSMSSAMDKVKNVDLWPFNDEPSNSQSRSYRPANSTEYQCDKGKKFFVRMLDKGDNLWLITKEREIGLAKVAQGEYSKDSTRLRLDKEQAELIMSADTPYTNCKMVVIK